MTMLKAITDSQRTFGHTVISIKQILVISFQRKINEVVNSSIDQSHFYMMTHIAAE